MYKNISLQITLKNCGKMVSYKNKKAHGMVDKVIMLLLYIALIVAAGAAIFLLVSKMA